MEQLGVQFARPPLRGILMTTGESAVAADCTPAKECSES